MPLQGVGLDVGGGGGVGGCHAKPFLTAALAINSQARTTESGIPTQAESMSSLCFEFWKSAGAPRHSRASSVECRPLSCLTGYIYTMPRSKRLIKKNLGD